MPRRLPDAFVLTLIALLSFGSADAADQTAAKPAAVVRGNGATPVIFKGTGYQFSLTAIPDWSIEPTGKTDGEIGHLYTRRDSAGTAPAIINVIADPNPAQGEIDFPGAIRSTLIAIKQGNPGLVLSKDSSITTASNQEALVFLFSREGTGLREAWAAIESSGAIVRMIYVARDEFGFRKHLPEFKQMVAGYIDLAPKKPPSDKAKKQTGPEKVK